VNVNGFPRSRESRGIVVWIDGKRIAIYWSSSYTYPAGAGIRPGKASCATIAGICWDYAVRRLERCPQEPKPSCKHCEIHCYKPIYREKIRDVMRYSGKRLILHGRLDLLWHYFF